MRVAEFNAVTWRGTIQIDGDVRDDAGNTYPAWKVRAGDMVLIEDAPELPYLPIVQTSYDHGSARLRADIGAPPDRGDALFARLASAAERVGV